jgi:serine/threonine protein kinase
MTEPGSQRELVEKLAEEFVERYRRGERPSLAEYIAAYPEQAEEIRVVFPALVMIEELAPGEDSSAAAAGPQPVAAQPSPPERVGGYRILREIGRGGMGIVYEAEHEALGRRVALKILNTQAAQETSGLARFRREARTAAQLHHTNIVPVFEVGEEGELCYYAMQFILGQGLDQVQLDLRRLRAGKESAAGAVARSLWTDHFEPADLTTAPPGDKASGRWNGMNSVLQPHAPETPTTRCRAADATAPASIILSSELSTLEIDCQHYFRSVARIGLQVAEALAYAHARGIIHRDIKPSNLLLDTAGVVWITDFGLAKTTDQALTQPGDIVGTIRYMSPERFRGECDIRADIYALGLTLYELLILEPAFDGADRLRLIDQIGHQEPTRPRVVDSRIPRDLETILMKAIDKEPRRRYASAEALAGDLRRFLADEPIQARRIGPLERLGRWGRRNPLVAGLSAAVVLVTALGFAGVFGQMQVAQANEHKAHEHAVQAEKERDEVRALNEQLRATQAQLRGTLYAAHLNLAHNAWEAGGIARARELLEQHRPKGGKRTCAASNGIISTGCATPTCSPSRGTPARSTAWPSVQTANAWPPPVMPSGIPPRMPTSVGK